MKKEYPDRIAYLNKKGQFHCLDGPAVECSDGTKKWFINGLCHREDGPAIEFSNGNKLWYFKGKLHREDGPAIEYPYVGKSYYLNGIRYSEEQYQTELVKIKLNRLIN